MNDLSHTMVELTSGMPLGPEERYEIVRLCGRGGMGIVYEAVDHGLDRPRPVAIKQLNKLFAQNVRFVDMIRREVGIARDLRHPNIVGVYEYVMWRGEHLVIMEWIDVVTLDEDLYAQPEKRYSLERTVERVQAIASALDYAHGKRPPVVHRDLKPLNVMLNRAGELKVTDFGLSREVKESVYKVTGRDGRDSSGSPEYMCY
jgi:serine/threonine-protein kinase